MEKETLQGGYYRDSIEEIGISEEMLEDPIASWRHEKETLRKKLFGRTETPFLLLGAGLVVLIVLFLVMVPKGGAGNVDTLLQGLSRRLEAMEGQLATLTAEAEKIAAVERQLGAWGATLARLESVDAGTVSRMDHLAEEMVLLKKEMEALTVKAAAATPSAGTLAPRSPSPSGAAPVYHQVQSGENLFRISQRYKVSVDALRRLNNLSAKADIYPGQKLVVKSGTN